MENKMSKADHVLTLGLIGIAGIILTIISDLILLGKPGNAFSFFKMGTESLADIAQWRITLGAFIGAVALPFQIAGVISVYHGLKPSGKVLPFIAVIADVHALIMGVAFHISYAFIGTVWKQHYGAGQGNQITSEILKTFDFYWRVILIIAIAELIVSSIIFVFLVMKGKTLYPKRMAFLNPLSVFLIMFPLIVIIPAPLGGFIAPTYLNASTMVFISISTTVIFKKLRA